MVSLTMPFPPSVNTYWRTPRKGKLAGRTLISAKGRAYREEAVGLAQTQQWGRKALEGRLAVTMTLFAPDRRQRDLDNYPKALLDALTHAQVWADDEQIDRLTVVRGPITKGGACLVSIEELSDGAA